MSERVTIDRLLTGDLTGVSRLLVQHVRKRQFRWLVLPELVIALTCCACILPFAVVAVAFTGVGMEALLVLSPRTRTFRYWHAIEIAVVDAQRGIVAELSFDPPNAEAGERVIAQLLERAAREGIVVVETVRHAEDQTAEIAEVWYGGRVLLARPEEHNEAQAEAVLAHHGVQVEREGDDRTLVRMARSRLGRLAALAVLLLLVVPLLPLLLLFQRGRSWCADVWGDVRGLPPAEIVLDMRPEALTVCERRGATERWTEKVDAREILGVTFSPTLGYGRAALAERPTLRIVSPRRTIIVPGDEQWSAMRHLIVGALLRMWRAHPELGLLGEGPHPTHCPYCSHLYLMGPGARCPHCGAPSGVAG